MSADAATLADPTGRVRRAISLPAASLLTENRVIFAAGLALSMATAFYLRYLDIYFGDAVSRSAQAHLVLSSRDPHLGAIGFVWNPLPSLVQVPLVAILDQLRLDVVLAASLHSALCASATLVVLSGMMRRAGMPDTMRRTLVALYAVNPMVLLYSAVGVSESMFILLIVVTMAYFLEWAESRSLLAFVGLTIAAALALQVRYEALALTAAVAVAVTIVLLGDARRLGRRAAARRFEGHLATFLAVSGYSFGMWVFFNWTIMGDPLYFLNSIYGNTTQTAPFREGDGSYLGSAIDSIGGALAYGTTMTATLFPAFLLTTAVALVVAARHRSGLLVALLSTAAAVPVFEILMVYRGQSFGWLRFFMYGIPFAFVLLVGLWRVAPTIVSGPRGRLWRAAALVVLLFSNAASLVAMDDPQMGREEHFATCRALLPSRPSASQSFQRWHVFSAALQTAFPTGTFLVDTTYGYPLPLLGDPKRYVVTSDRDFDETLAGQFDDVDYLLVPNPAFAERDRINLEYPELWDGSMPGTTLAAWFTLDSGNAFSQWSWKVYAVTPVATESAGGRAVAQTVMPVLLRASEECGEGAGLRDRIGSLLAGDLSRD